MNVHHRQVTIKVTVKLQLKSKKSEFQFYVHLSRSLCNQALGLLREIYTHTPTQIQSNLYDDTLKYVDINDTLYNDTSINFIYSFSSKSSEEGQETYTEREE